MELIFQLRSQKINQISLLVEIKVETKRCLILGRKAMTNLDRILKCREHYFADKGPSSQSFFSSHVGMSELDHKEDWTAKKWCFQTVVLEKTLESLLDSKEIKLVNPKGNQPWIFIGKTNVEAEALILWSPDAKSWLIWKICWYWKRLRAGGEESNRGWDGWMASSAHCTWFWANPGDSEGLESLACCSPLGCK